jgi:hypothetical protein
MSDDTAARDRLTARQCRERARLIRRQAEDTGDRPTVREQLLYLAEKYEQLADSMERARFNQAAAELLQIDGGASGKRDG